MLRPYISAQGAFHFCFFIFFGPDFVFSLQEQLHIVEAEEKLQKELVTNGRDNDDSLPCM